MKLEDAPPPGWYPDPERVGRLRWWEGTDWTDERRALPSPTELRNITEAAADAPLVGDRPGRPPFQQRERPDTSELVSQVRAAAREEVNRAADLFTHRARTAINRGRSLAADYVATVLRWIRIAIVVAAVLVIAWFVFQVIAQATFLEWVGDRIDNITGD